jgi:hypothetical protein
MNDDKRRMIEALTDLEMAQFDLDALTAQLGHLLDHLMAAGVVDPDELDEEPQLDVRWLDKEAGEAMVAVRIEGILYCEDPTTGNLHAEREYGGGLEWTIISDDDGSFGRWHRVAPPAWRVQGTDDQSGARGPRPGAPGLSGAGVHLRGRDHDRDDRSGARSVRGGRARGLVPAAPRDAGKPAGRAQTPEPLSRAIWGRSVDRRLGLSS